MTLLVVGISHHTATFDVLERLSAISSAALRGDVIASDQVAEVMVVSTCNRVEVYAEVDRFHAGVDVIVALLAKRARLGVEDMTARCFVHFDGRAVQHMFEVASGLDSMVVGEQQILGQVRSSFADAQEAGTADRELHDVAQAALRVGKEVRSRTEIDKAGASVVSVGLSAALAELERLGGPVAADLRAAVLGSGTMAGLAAAALARLGVAGMAIVSRNPDQGRRLADRRGGEAVPFSNLASQLVEADLVVCCTGASETVLSVEHVDSANSDRARRPLVVLDLALPHDAEPEIASIPNVVRLDLAFLSNRSETQPDMAEVELARKLIDEELALFAQARAARAVEPVVLRLRSQASAVAEAELGRMRQRMPNMAPDEWEQVERGLRRVVATLLHTPTVRVKQLAADPDGERYAQALSSLFDLSVDVVDAVVLPRDVRDPWPEDVGAS